MLFQLILGVESRATRRYATLEGWFSLSEHNGIEMAIVAVLQKGNLRCEVSLTSVHITDKTVTFCNPTCVISLLFRLDSISSQKIFQFNCSTNHDEMDCSQKTWNSSVLRSGEMIDRRAEDIKVSVACYVHSPDMMLPRGWSWQREFL
jgi:hypothetical protein